MINLSGLEALINKHIKDIQAGKVRTGGLTEEQISDALWGTPPPLSERAVAVKTNPYRFRPRFQLLYLLSGAPTFDLFVKANDFITECLNKDVRERDMIIYAKEHLPKYNIDLLKKEYMTIRQLHTHADNWLAYNAKYVRFDKLTYQTQKGGCTIPSHNQLHNVAAPVNSEFYKNCYPPNDFECTCYVRQTNDPDTADADSLIGTINPLFRFNPYFIDKGFSPENPRFLIQRTEANLALIKTTFNKGSWILRLFKKNKNPFLEGLLGIMNDEL